MPETKVPPAPKGLQATGRRLWRAILADYHLEVHELLTLTEACRVIDRLDRIAAEVEDAPLTVTNHRGDEVSNPLLCEARAQEIVYTRLIASLRLPDTDETIRPQRRGGARGTYSTQSTHPRWQQSS
jgi:hypothetical protein